MWQGGMAKGWQGGGKGVARGWQGGGKGVAREARSRREVKAALRVVVCGVECVWSVCGVGGGWWVVDVWLLCSHTVT